MTAVGVPRPWWRTIPAVRARPLLLGAFAAALSGAVAVPVTQARLLRAVAEPTPHARDRRSGGSGVRVAWFGDSLAAGVGADDADGTLPYLVAERIADAAGAPVDITVLAVPGATVGDVAGEQLARFDALVAGGYHADLVVVSVGANDIAAFTPRARFRATYRTVLARVGDIPTVVLSIPELRDALRLPQPLRSLAALRGRWLQAAIESVAIDAGVPVVDVAARPEASRAEVLSYLSPDRFHPSTAGYRRWADATWTVLVEGAVLALSAHGATVGSRQFPEADVARS